MSASVPGPKARNHISTSARSPVASSQGSIPAPSHDSVAAQLCRDTLHEPLFDARTTLPDADSTVSTRGPNETFPPHDFPTP